MVLSMDAIFGLPRKKSAGVSYGDAIHGHYFFEDQSKVDEFVLSVPSRRQKDIKVPCTMHNYALKSEMFNSDV